MTINTTQIGDEAERRFRQWLDNKNISYWYIDQSQETISKALKQHFGTEAKRPDFMILLPNFGFILVDVKYREISKEFETFPIDVEETTKYANLERKFKLPVWFVMTHKNFGYKTWYWIPTSKILEKNERKKHINKANGKQFYGIQVDEFVQIPHDKSIDILFTDYFIKETQT